MKLIVDAVSKGSGGAKRHLIEILNYSDKSFCNFTSIEIWGPKSLLDVLPDKKKIIKKTHFLLNSGVLGFLIWGLLFKKKSFGKDFDCIFSPFGNFTKNLHPYVSMSQNMLMFEETERKRFKFGFLRIKLEFMLYVNKKSFENADGLIFLSKHAKAQINNLLRLDQVNQTIIHHGISKEFFKSPRVFTKDTSTPIKLLYVSNILPYKHHLNTVKAILDLNLIEGYNISLLLIGNNDYSSIGKKLNNLICKHNIVQWITEVKLDEIYKYYHDSDCFIFSSSCENMPISLIEAMASGLPIVCSNYKPMQEFLENAGLYFDPLSIDDTKNVLRKILDDKKLLKKLSKDSYNLSKKYTWEQCAQNTFKYLYEISKN